MKRWLLITLALAIAAGAALLVLRPGSRPAGQPAASVAPQAGKAAAAGAAADAPASSAIEFASTDLHTIGTGTIARTIPVTGTLTPVERTTVKAKVAGEIVGIAVREGGVVTRGQLLARLESSWTTNPATCGRSASSSSSVVPVLPISGAVMATICPRYEGSVSTSW